MTTEQQFDSLINQAVANPEKPSPATGFAQNVKVQLNVPVLFEGQPTTEIMVHGIKVKDLVQAQKLANDMQISIHLLCAATRLEKPAIENMDVRDFKKLSQAVEPFLA